MKEFDLIVKYSGVKPSSCTCDKCQSMCKQAPCIGTPLDILRLIQNGYIEYLEMYNWQAGLDIGIPSTPMVQISGKKEDNCCPLFVNGRCSINPIKPTDGKLASCSKHASHRYLKFIAQLWTIDKFQGLVKFLDFLVITYAITKDKAAIKELSNTFKIPE